MNTDPPASDASSHEQFVALFARYQRRVFAYIGTLLTNVADAEEVMQETSIILWRKWSEFDQSRDFVRWANGIAYREVLRYLRQRKSARLHFSDEMISQIADAYQQRIAEQDARAEALTHCVAKLPRAERDLVEHRYRENTSVNDMAQRLGRPAKSIYRSLERIRQRLFECVQRTLSSQGQG